MCYYQDMSDQEKLSKYGRERLLIKLDKGLAFAGAGQGTLRDGHRAADTLYNAKLPKPSVKEESMKAKMEDGRRWLNLIKKCTLAGTAPGKTAGKEVKKA